MDKPIYQLPFGTNWFCPSILCMDKLQSILALGINDTIHVMSLHPYTPLYDLYAPSKERILTLTFLDDDSLLFVTSSHLLIYQKQQ